MRSSPRATNTRRDRDLGAAYAMKPAWTRTELTSVVRGSPMGKLLRRYWHPWALRPTPSTSQKSSRTGRGPDPASRQRRPRRPLARPLAAATAAPRSIMARSRTVASATATMGGSSTRSAIARSNPASPKAAGSRTSSPALIPRTRALPADRRPDGPRGENAGAARLRSARGGMRSDRHFVRRGGGTGDIRGRKLHPRGRKTSLKKQSGEGNMVDLALRASAQLRTLPPPRRGAISK